MEVIGLQLVQDEYETPEKTKMRNEWLSGKHEMDDKDKRYDILVKDPNNIGHYFAYPDTLEDEYGGKIGGGPHSDGSRLSNPLAALEMYAKSGMIGDLRIVDTEGKPLQLNKKKDDKQE